MSDELPPLKHYVYESMRTRIDSGFFSKKQVFDALADEISSAAELAPEAGKLRGYTAKRWAAREAEERTWRERTMNDAIDDAFAAMNQAGLVALQNAGWTNTTGWEDAWDEYRARSERGPAPRGAVFYHYQSLERGVQGEGLMLNFGCFHEADDGDPEGNARIAAEACRILAAHGVPTRWDGDPGCKIEIPPFVWRRRRLTAAPPAPSAWRRYGHADGRVWAVRVVGDALDVQITLPAEIAGAAPERVERRRQASNPGAAAALAEQLIAEQLADGFAVIPEAAADPQGDP